FTSPTATTEVERSTAAGKRALVSSRSDVVQLPIRISGVSATTTASRQPSLSRSTQSMSWVAVLVDAGSPALAFANVAGTVLPGTMRKQFDANVAAPCAITACTNIGVSAGGVATDTENLPFAPMMPMPTATWLGERHSTGSEG